MIQSRFNRSHSTERGGAVYLVGNKAQERRIKLNCCRRLRGWSTSNEAPDRRPVATRLFRRPNGIELEAGNLLWISREQSMLQTALKTRQRVCNLVSCRCVRSLYSAARRNVSRLCLTFFIFSKGSADLVVDRLPFCLNDSSDFSVLFRLFIPKKERESAVLLAFYSVEASISSAVPNGAH